MSFDQHFLRTMEMHVEEILSLTESVVNIDSGSYCRDGVNQVQGIFASALTEAGFEVSRQPLEGFGDQLTARWKSASNGPRVLVLGHADTVWPEGTAAEWKYERRDALITGPGVGDMKVCVATAIVALRELIKTQDTGVGSITFLIVPDEELGSGMSSEWIENEARQADYCVTLEPARPNRGLVIGRGAVGHLSVQVEGITAHVAHNRKGGASAIAVLARLITELEAISDTERKLSVSVGLIDGGEARQVVPAKASFEADLRASDLAGRKELIDKIEQQIAKVKASSDPRIKITHDIRLRPPFEASAANKKLFETAAQIAGELGFDVHPLVSPGGSDASFAGAIGVPTIDGLGPITHEMCSRRERTEIHSIATQGALLACLIRRAASV